MSTIGELKGLWVLIIWILQLVCWFQIFQNKILGKNVEKKKVKTEIFKTSHSEQLYLASWPILQW